MAGDECYFLGFCRIKLLFFDVYFAGGAVSLGTRDARVPVGCFGGAGDAESMRGSRATGCPTSMSSP